MRTFILFMSVLSFACTPSARPADAPATTSADTLEPDHVAPDEGDDGVEIVTLQGLIDVDSAVGEQGFAGVWLETSSTRYVLAFRPEDRFLPLQGRPVSVTGYVECTPPDVHAVGSTYFVVQDIEYAL